MRLSNSGSQTALAAAGDVQAPLNAIVRQNGTPYFLSAALTGGTPDYHFRTEARTVTIHDIRPEADRLSVEREGFQPFRNRTSVDDLYDDETVAGACSREVEALLCEATGASRSIAFDHPRRSVNGDGAAKPDGMCGPARIVHVDCTVTSGPQLATGALGHETVERVLDNGARIAEINVWRPISGPVPRSPLVLGLRHDAGRNARDKGLGQSRRQPGPLHPPRLDWPTGPGFGCAATREHRNARLPRLRRPRAGSRPLVTAEMQQQGKENLPWPATSM